MADPALAPAVPQPHRAAARVVHANFVLTGIATTLVSPLLPFLAAHWALRDVQAGTLFTLQFCGSMAGTLLATWLLPRAGFRGTLVAGALCMAVGVASIAFAAWPAGSLCFFGLGIGLGLTIPTSNMYIAAIAGERSAAALSLLNFAWGAGAIAGPWLVGFAGEQYVVALLAALAAALLLSGVTMAWSEWPAARAVAHAPSALQDL